MKGDGDQQVTVWHQTSVFLPDGADHVDEIEPSRIGHDLRRGGSRGYGRTHGGQGNGHDRQGLA